MEERMEKEVSTALEVLQNGGTIIYPTDTVWGIGCDATDEKAVEKVLDLKGRDRENKSLIVLVDQEAMIERYVKEVPSMAWDLLDAADKPLTIVYPEAKHLAGSIPATDGSVGVRVTPDSFCRELIRRLRKPLVSTSANKTGQAPPAAFQEIDPDLLASADHVVNWRQEEVGEGRPSSVIRLGVNNEVEIIRE